MILKNNDNDDDNILTAKHNMYDKTPPLFRREEMVRTLKCKSLKSPDEIPSFEKGKVELVNFENVVIRRAVLN